MQEIEREHLAHIALGSNLGDREANLRRALELMQENGMRLKEVSSFYTTEPYGVTDQPQFLNACCSVYTRLSPLELLHQLLTIENAMGRVRLRHWGERNIDLDLLLYEDVVLDTKELCLPHPELHMRGFVLAPLCEIAGDVEHPVLHKKIRQLYAELPE